MKRMRTFRHRRAFHDNLIDSFFIAAATQLSFYLRRFLLLAASPCVFGHERARYFDFGCWQYRCVALAVLPLFTLFSMLMMLETSSREFIFWPSQRPPHCRSA